MASSKSNPSAEEILRRLSDQAKASLGERRAQEIHTTLHVAAKQLEEVSNNLPDKETEPGFYQ